MKFPAALWLFLSKVVFLRRVMLQVVEFQRSVLEVFYQFPGPLPDYSTGSCPEILEGRAEILSVALEVGREMPEERAFGE